MKLYKLSALMLGTLALAACSDIDDQLPESGTLTAEQVRETNSAIASRLDASFNGMYTMFGKPHTVWPTGGNSSRADDMGFITCCLSQDLEGADATSPNSGYNWFSSACALSTRTPTYANPYMRYKMPYSLIGAANEIISGVDFESASATTAAHAAEAYAARAYGYLMLAPYFQGSYDGHADDPCVPILNLGTDASNNPRATVREVYNQIVSDLTFAIEHLEGYTRASKVEIDQNVAYGLRARAYLAMGEWAKAAEDAEKAMQGYTPASLDEVSVPTFCNINEANWMWGIDITDDQVQSDGYPTSSSWISSFSGDGYAAGAGCYLSINKLLYDKIPASDVRKGWWLDENMHSDNIASLSWTDPDGTVAQGDAIATLVTSDGSKLAMTPYANVKFGMQSGVGSTLNNNDWPLMRVEEMILIQAEGLAKSGQTGRAQQVLENFVKTYRDPSYSVSGRGLTLADEIWFQRRVELWGEGFFTADARRLSKPIVRFHTGVASNLPDAFTFNIAADDPWLNMRFALTETNYNTGIVNNTGGSQPVAGQNGNLRDGVTD